MDLALAKYSETFGVDSGEELEETIHLIRTSSFFGKFPCALPLPSPCKPRTRNRHQCISSPTTASHTPANWSIGVPIDNTFHAINNTDFIIRLDIDPTINSLTLGADSGRLFGTDHNLTVTGSTGMGPGNRLDVVAQSLPNVKFDLGNLTNFGTTSNSGGYFVTATPGTTSKLQFNGANIVTNDARIGIIGAGAAILDENGVNALANLTTNGVDGFIRIGSGASFTTANNFTNGGYMVARPGGMYTFNGSFACVTNPANPDAGLFEVLAPTSGQRRAAGMDCWPRMAASAM